MMIESLVEDEFVDENGAVGLVQRIGFFFGWFT